MDKKTAQLELFIVGVFQLDRAETTLDARQRVDRLTNEVWISKYIFILDCKSYQSKIRVDNVKLAPLIPEWAKSILLYNGNVKKK